MTEVVPQHQKIYRIYGYGLVGLLQLALIVIRGRLQSLRIYSMPIILFLIWAGLSLAWTQHLDLTSKRTVLLLIVYTAIFGGTCDLPAQRSQGILRIVLVVALVFNFVAVFTVPEISTHVKSGGLWRGLMAHKNIAGMLCGFTVIAFVFDSAKVPVAARVTVIAAALVFLLQSWSKTTLISLPIALASGGAVAFFGTRRSAIKEIHKLLTVWPQVFLTIAVAFLIALTLQRDFLLSLTEDTTALTTRASIWRPMIEFYLDHPLLGSGYGAYWDASANLSNHHGSGPVGVWDNVDQGHNGYLDLLVQVGLPGLTLALYAAFVWPIAQVGSMIERRPHRAALISAFLIFLLVENFSESSLLADDALGNAFLLMALAQLHRFKLLSKGKATGRRRRRSAMASVDTAKN